MAIKTFIPEVWSARILENLNKTLVYTNLVNRDYEGEITQYGDTVHVGSIGRVAVKAYEQNTDIAAPDQLAMTDQTLIIDQGDYFNIAIDDVDAAQARANVLDTAAASVSYEFGDKADKYVAGLLKAGTITDGLGTDAVALNIDETNAYEYMVHMKTALDKANVPKQGRWIVLPPEFEGYMLLDARFASGQGTNAESRLVNGAVARAAGFDIYISNNVPASTDGYKIIASTNMCGTYADQILETEAYRPEKRFGDAIKGLHVYGAKLLRPEIVAVATCKFGASA